MISEDHQFLDKVRDALTKEYMQRLLIKYFTEKGFDNFNKLVYPPMLMDLGHRIPELANKVEIMPYTKEINPATGQVTIGWNYFVLGTQRMELGETTHANKQDLQNSASGPTPQSQAKKEKSPKDIIDFTMRVLGSSKAGMVRPAPAGYQPGPSSNRPKMGPTASGGYYERRR